MSKVDDARKALVSTSCIDSGQWSCNTDEALDALIAAVREECAVIADLLCVASKMTPQERWVAAEIASRIRTEPP